MKDIRRRTGTVMGAAVSLVAVVVSACGSSSAGTSTTSKASASAAGYPTPGSSPISLNILDIAGNLQLSAGAITEFANAHTNWLSGQPSETTAAAPTLVSKLQPEEQSGNVTTDLVLTGTDGLASGIVNGLWDPLVPQYSALFGTASALKAKYIPGAWNMMFLAQDAAKSYECVELDFYPSGPLLAYNPAVVTDPPTTPQALLTWAQANPGKFEYADPANSGPGRTFVQGLPYLLGDSNPQNPQTGWTKTWAYLAQLGQTIPKYQTGTTATMKDLADGTVDMIATTTGWDLSEKVNGTIPANFKVTNFAKMTWVNDAQYACVPKGLPKATEAVVLQLINWMLKPQEQAYAYDNGYFYPGPAIANVPLTQAPAQDQTEINQYKYPDFDTWIKEFPNAVQVTASNFTYFTQYWKQNIAAGKE